MCIYVGDTWDTGISFLYNSSWYKKRKGYFLDNKMLKMSILFYNKNIQFTKIKEE